MFLLFLLLLLLGEKITIKTNNNNKIIIIYSFFSLSFFSLSLIYFVWRLKLILLNISCFLFSTLWRRFKRFFMVFIGGLFSLSLLSFFSSSLDVYFVILFLLSIIKLYIFEGFFLFFVFSLFFYRLFIWDIYKKNEEDFLFLLKIYS